MLFRSVDQELARLDGVLVCVVTDVSFYTSNTVTKNGPWDILLDLVAMEVAVW